MRVVSGLALAALAVVAAGCGGNGGEETAAQAEQKPTRPPVGVVLAEFSVPAEITLKSSGRYTFLVENEGTKMHAFEIEGQGLEEKTDEIGPGDTTELTVDLKEGEYEMYCPVGDHKDRGMVGTLIVGAGGGAGTQTETETKTVETETGGGSPGY